VAWLRLAGAALYILMVSFWLFVVEVEAPALSVLLTVASVALAGPAWTHPRESGAILVTVAGAYGLFLMHDLRHPLLAELTLVAPLMGVGLLLLGDVLLHPAPA
jgi:hypothetical protein